MALQQSVNVAPPSEPVLSRAMQPFSTVIGTLDALHLATVLVIQAL